MKAGVELAGGIRAVLAAARSLMPLGGGLPYCQGRRAGLALPFFLDLDGTLAPLAPVPDQACVPVVVRGLLQDLHSFPRCQVWVVTGRPVAEAMRLVGIPEIGYAGVHGLEVRWPGAEGCTQYPVNLDAFLPALAAARHALCRELASVPGCLVEDKGDFGSGALSSGQ